MKLRSRIIFAMFLNQDCIHDNPTDFQLSWTKSKHFRVKASSHCDWGLENMNQGTILILAYLPSLLIFMKSGTRAKGTVQYRTLLSMSKNLFRSYTKTNEMFQDRQTFLVCEQSAAFSLFSHNGKH